MSAATTDDLVTYEVCDGVATLTLNRPDRNNAWGFDMEQAFFDHVDRADDDPDVRVVVITGAGRSFCPGMDMKALADLGQTAGVAERARAMTHLRSLRKMSIAAINGGCAGIGLVQAALCDVRFAAAEAKLSCSFPRRGAPAEYGMSWLLPRMIGLAAATELLLSGRTFAADEALALGLVHRVYPRAELASRVFDYARDIATHCAPLSVQAIKSQLEADMDSTLDESVRRARAIAHEQWRRPDLSEGARAYLERRPPAFLPLSARTAAEKGSSS